MFLDSNKARVYLKNSIQTDITTYDLFGNGEGPCGGAECDIFGGKG